MEYVLRFLIGGLVVSIFAVIGNTFRPRTFSGLFGAAPTIALATLGLAFASKGAAYVAVEGRSMMLGAAGMFVYALLSRYLLLHRNWNSIPSTVLPYLGWLGVSLGLWYFLLR